MTNVHVSMFRQIGDVVDKPLVPRCHFDNIKLSQFVTVHVYESFSYQNKPPRSVLLITNNLRSILRNTNSCQKYFINIAVAGPSERI